MNMSSPFSAPPRLLGVRLSDTSTTQRHELGSVIVGVDGGQYRYVKAGEALTAYKPVDYTAAFNAYETDAGDLIMGVPQVSIASASYGWVLERGVGVLMVTASLAAGPIGQYCTVGGLGNAALETKAGEGTRALTFAQEAGTPAGVSAILI
jgi:hypothetical protein